MTTKKEQNTLRNNTEEKIDQSLDFFKIDSVDNDSSRIDIENEVQSKKLIIALPKLQKKQNKIKREILKGKNPFRSQINRNKNLGKSYLEKLRLSGYRVKTAK
eukprot:TRINITY_DN3319_c2_g1_i1.p1 TRINITY_DN3319_c2_g1~~TRINITY_DN3319_c2_g1_i1.p1  ORF type:complete len:103 (+),score=24.03 TRINITY_DN3319_c2_g1_i1:50-358(+)